jgi:hypothetical protein
MNQRALPFGVVFAPLCLMLLGGCSTYVEGFHYVPRPAVALVPGTQPSQPPPTAAIVSVVGVHREDRGAGIPESVEVRMRVENNGPENVVFDPRTMELLDGGLMEFPPPVLRPAQVIALAPQQSVVVGAFFPFPPGRSYKNTDLESLQLRWHLQLGGSEVGQAADFRRMIRPYYYYPYPDYAYPYGFYGGVGVGIGFGGRHRF